MGYLPQMLKTKESLIVLPVNNALLKLQSSGTYEDLSWAQLARQKQLWLWTRSSRPTHSSSLPSAGCSGYTGIRVEREEDRSLSLSLFFVISKTIAAWTCCAWKWALSSPLGKVPHSVASLPRICGQRRGGLASPQLEMMSSCDEQAPLPTSQGWGHGLERGMLTRTSATFQAQPQLPNISHLWPSPRPTPTAKGQQHQFLLAQNNQQWDDTGKKTQTGALLMFYYVKWFTWDSLFNPICNKNVELAKARFLKVELLKNLYLYRSFITSLCRGATWIIA